MVQHSMNTYQSNISLNSNFDLNDSPSMQDIKMNEFENIPLSALSKQSRKKLSNLLNSRKILRSEEGYERDWRGLAFLAKQRSLCDETIIRDNDPMAKVIQFWCINNPQTATFGNLEQYLGIIDRWDVCDDILEDLVEDAKIYKKKDMLNISLENSLDSAFNNKIDYCPELDANILTTDDIHRAEKGLSPQIYDAFVLYADADLNYVTEMLSKLEDSTDYNFKLCIKDRDLLGGVASKYVALTQLIEERCRYLIIILTKAFLKSAENKFLIDFTQAIQIEHKTRKIIPLIYEDSLEIPRTLNIYTHLRYNNNLISFCDFWKKLANSIKNVNLEYVSRTFVRSDILRTQVISSDNQTKTLTLPTNVPSISVNGHSLNLDCDGNSEHDDYSENTTGIKLSDGNENIEEEDPVLRNAHSTGHLYSLYQTELTSSTSTVATACDSKKKRKWPKLLKKVFNRNSSKIQNQTA